MITSSPSGKIRSSVSFMLPLKELPTIVSVEGNTILLTFPPPVKLPKILSIPSPTRIVSTPENCVRRKDMVMPVTSIVSKVPSSSISVFTCERNESAGIFLHVMESTS